MKNDHVILITRLGKCKTKYTTKDLRVGQVGILAEQYEDGLVMKEWSNNLVLLNNPLHTWSNGAVLDLKEILPAGTRIEITLSR